VLKRSVPLAVAAVLLAAGCGSGSDKPTVSGPSASAAPLAHLLPADVRSKGTLTVGSDIS